MGFYPNSANRMVIALGRVYISDKPKMQVLRYNFHSHLTHTTRTKNQLKILIFYFQFPLKHRNKFLNILPWPNDSYVSKIFEAPNISIDVVTKPNENLGIKNIYCILDRLRSALLGQEQKTIRETRASSKALPLIIAKKQDLQRTEHSATNILC